MFKDNIQWVIDKVSKGDVENYEEVCYEGYGLGGVVLIVEVLIDNCNCIVINVCIVFVKNGGNFGVLGVVSYGFEWFGLIEYLVKVGDEEKVFEVVIEVGVDDVESDISEDGLYLIWISVENLYLVLCEFEKVLGEVEVVKFVWCLSFKVEVGESDVVILFKLIDVFDDDDDVQIVWGNYDIFDDVMEKLG